jgi:hypothetical protein
MTQSPIIKTLDEMLAKLKEAVGVYREAAMSVDAYTTAVRALAQVCEDEEIKASYLLALEEVTGKPGFADAVRSALKASATPLSAKAVKGTILLMKKMDLSGYSNPMASIHTTLRRLKDKGEVQEITNTQGEKLYRLTLKTAMQADGFTGKLGKNVMPKN